MIVLATGSRRIIIADLSAVVPADTSSSFVAFFLDDELPSQRVLDTVAAGCAELCFVGPRAEQAHDSADHVLEASGHLSIVTTYVVDETEACEYVVHAAMGGRLDVIAHVAASTSVVTKLVATVEGAEDGVRAGGAVNIQEHGACRANPRGGSTRFRGAPWLRRSRAVPPVPAPERAECQPLVRGRDA